MDYLTALALIHEGLVPANYVEIGCREGRSLALARCPSVAIDPDFEIRMPLSAPTRLYRETSDAFFADHDLRALLCEPLDVAFVDGMHRAEFVLRDFLNLETAAAHNSVIVIDDVLPEDIDWTGRDRGGRGAWTGDVYKIVPFLRRHRPDLSVEVFDVEMKGLALVTRLNPGDRSVRHDLARHEAALAGAEYAVSDISALRETLAPVEAERLAARIADLAVGRRLSAAGRPAGTADLYLDLLRRSLLNEVYLDDEARLFYLRGCLEEGDRYDYAVLHDIRRSRPELMEELAAARRIGRFPYCDISKSGFSHTMMGRLRLDSLQACLNDVHARCIPGDLVECGVWRGGGCILMAGWLAARGVRDRKVIVADSFEGLPPPSLPQDKGIDLSQSRFPQLAVSEEAVRAAFAAYGLHDDTRVRFLKGWFRDTLGDAPTTRIALLRLDGDLYESTMNALVALYDRVSPGGIVIVDDYGALAVCRQALEDFFAPRAEPVPPLTRIDWTGAFFVKPVAP